MYKHDDSFGESSLLHSMSRPAVSENQPGAVQRNLTVPVEQPTVDNASDFPRYLSRAPQSVARRAVLQLQRLYGNFSVRRMLQRSGSAGESNADVTPEVERSIDRSRGAGQPLDGAMRSSMGHALNADFSGVRVHTDSRANNLNHALSARAFTTGQDIYFRQGEYDPGSSKGRELLAHELTHVVQQNAGVIQNKQDEDPGAEACPNCSRGASRSLQTKLALGNPGDIYEQEADSVARAFSLRETQSATGNEGSAPVRRRTLDDEKKEEHMHAKQVDGTLRRQPEDDRDKEKAVRAKPDTDGLQRLTEEDEKKKHT